MSKASDDIQERELHQLQLMQENAKESCMASFRLLHSFLQVLSYDESKSRRVSERTFMTPFGQDNESFTSTMFLMDQLQRQLDKDEFQEDKSMAAFWVIDSQFQKFIDWQYFVDYDSQMIEKIFLLNTPESKLHSLEKHYSNTWAMLRSLLLKEHIIKDSMKEGNGTESGMHDTSSSSGNYITHVVDANIRPVNDQVPFAEVQLTAQHNVLANEQQHTHQSEPIYDIYLLEKVDSNTSPGLTNMSHRGGEIDQAAEHDQEKVFTNAALKNELRKLKGTCVDTKFAKPLILRKPILQPHRNQSVVRQLAAFKSERCKFSKPRFASQVDVINDLSKPVTPHYVPKVRESVFVKHHHVIASGLSRNNSNESYGSNDMAHKYYLEKCVFNANHDDCITNFLKRVNSHAKVQSSKTRNINKPIELKSHTQKHDRQIAIGQRFSLNKSSTVREKPNTLRSCLMWIPTGRIFKTAGLRWIPTGNMFTDNTTKVDGEPPNGSNEDITNPYECKQSLDFMQNSVSPTPYVPPSKKDYETLFQQLFDEYFNPPPRAISPVSAAIAAPRAVDPAGSPSSTTIDQDVPSASSSPTT
uniref:Integrase, catalytic region, zinc finger, CCHC-type, peptidase aspartic, catalytic n=1 Tax=Tanacetum cinerariifolium TaxID=118510 RepID=A0A6L2J707_TANCI|nr:hypothetical protein [Tanacetum cinerariifolium]